MVTLDPKERFCGCGGVGHLEGIMGHRAMRLRFLDMEPEEVFVAARHGDQRACEFWKLWHRALAAGTATSIHLDGPGHFYIAGPNADFVRSAPARRLHAGDGKDEPAARQLLPDRAHQPRHGCDRSRGSKPSQVTNRSPDRKGGVFPVRYTTVLVPSYMRRILVSTTLLSVLSLAVWVSVRPAHSQSKPKAAKAIAAVTASYGNMDAISEAEMKIYLYFLASDQLEGRNLPSRGFDTAALYVASHLAEWGLKPGGSTTNTVGPLQPYLMPFELVSKQVVPEQSKASITAPPAAGGAADAAAVVAVAERAVERLPRRRAPRNSNTPRIGP